MRTVTIPQQTVIEAIQSVNYQIGAYVETVIGIGNIIDGQFFFAVPQQFDNVQIIDRPAIVDPQTGNVISPAITDFSDLNAQYPNGSWTTDDLWPYIDRVRARRI